MTVVKVDVDELEAFGRDLRGYANESREHLLRLSQRLQDMGSGNWSDRKFTEFAGEFERVERTLNSTLEEIESELTMKIDTMVRHLRDYEST